MHQYIYTDDKKTLIQCSDGRYIPACIGNRDYDTLISNDIKISDYVVQHPSLADVQSAKRMEINASFDAALAASLTMPSVNTPPSAVEVAVGAAALAAVDADGPAYIMQTHSARRTSLLSAVDAATSVEAVQAITVSYAV